jgi:predicted phage replisome organizer
MADVQWIKITTAMFDDEKIKLIESMPDKDSILIIWIKLLVQAGKCNATGYIYLSETLPYTDEMLSTIFNRPLNTIRFALSVFQKFGMIELSEDGSIYINNWGKHQNIAGLEKIREQTRERVAKLREKQKQIEDVTKDVTLRNATEEEKKRKEKKKNKTLCVYSNAFQEFWNVYPKHTGKKAAFKQWEKMKPTGLLPPLDVILSAVNDQKRVKAKALETGQFAPEWPDPERWIKNARWEDEPESLIGQTGGSNGNSRKRSAEPTQNWYDREADAEIERLNEKFRKDQAAKAAARNTA